MANYTLEVSEIDRETADAVSISFEVPEDLKEIFLFKPGQYLTVEFEVENKKIRRAYSICTAPHEEKLSITVKSVAPGGTSHYLCNSLKTGDQLSVLPPSGKFTPELNPEERVYYYMIGAGSGITPLYSMIKAILEDQPLSTVHLLYGNRTLADTIYKDALIALSEKYDGQLFIRFQLSGEGSKLLSYQAKETGRINEKCLDDFLSDFPLQSTRQKFFICGPGKLIEDTEAYLRGMGISEEDIRAERFQNKKTQESSTDKNNSMSKATITLDGNIIELEIKDDNILQTLIDAGYDPPFSCTSGVCTTCMAKVTKGSVTMDENYGLDEDEVAKGYILTCQSHPTSEEIELTYDDL